MVKHPDIRSGNTCLVYSFPENIISTLKETIGDSAVITSLDWFQDDCINLYAFLFHNESVVLNLQSPFSSSIPSFSNITFCSIATEQWWTQCFSARPYAG